MGPHWLSPNVAGNKIVMTGFFKELEKKVLMLNFDSKSGELSIDDKFGIRQSKWCWIYALIERNGLMCKVRCSWSNILAIGTS